MGTLSSRQPGYHTVYAYADRRPSLEFRLCGVRHGWQHLRSGVPGVSSDPDADILAQPHADSEAGTDLGADPDFRAVSDAGNHSDPLAFGHPNANPVAYADATASSNAKAESDRVVLFYRRGAVSAKPIT